MSPAHGSAVPHHIGLIMDGNGRWAAGQGLSRSAGHAQAGYAVERTIDAALRTEVKWLTFFSFSTENWGRDRAGVEFLLRPENWLMSRETAADLARKGVAVHVTGDFADPRLPDAVRQWKEDLEKVTSDAAERLTITIAFNYGGQQEIGPG